MPPKTKHNFNMPWNSISGKPKGIRVVFADKTFLDFPGKHAQVLITGNEYSGELLVGHYSQDRDRSGTYPWEGVAAFPKGSYSYVIPIP